MFDFFPCLVARKMLEIKKRILIDILIPQILEIFRSFFFVRYVHNYLYSFSLEIFYGFIIVKILNTSLLN